MSVYLHTANLYPFLQWRKEMQNPGVQGGKDAKQKEDATDGTKRKQLMTKK